MTNAIDTVTISARMREQVLDIPNKRFLLSRIRGSEQERDLTEPTNCNGLGRIRHFRLDTSVSWPTNPLPILPACNKLGIVSRGKMNAQVFQLAACMWRCWYCFVPYDLLAAAPKTSEWVTAEQIVDMYASIEQRPQIMDLSGGSPDLAPEWILWMMESLKRKGLQDSVYLWSDDNLSTEYLFDMAPRDLQLMSTYSNYGRVCCFKGFNEESFVFNTRARAQDFDRQFQIMQRLLGETELDLYGYVTLTAPTDLDMEQEMSCFFDRLQRVHPNLPLRMIPLEIRTFTPTQGRMTTECEKALSHQQQAISYWNQEIEKRFSAQQRETAIHEIRLR